jgi:hypothetical protein
MGEIVVGYKNYCVRSYNLKKITGQHFKYKPTGTGGSAE